MSAASRAMRPGCPDSLQAAEQGERVVDAERAGVGREAVAFAPFPPCIQYVLSPEPRLQAFQFVPVGCQVQGHLVLREPAECAIPGQIGNVEEIVGRREQVGACKACDAGHEDSVEPPLVVLQHAEKVAQFLDRGLQGTVGPDVLDNGRVVLVHQDYGTAAVDVRQPLNQGSQHGGRGRPEAVGHGPVS